MGVNDLIDAQPTAPSRLTIATRLKQRAAELGFSSARITDAQAFVVEREALIGRIQAGLYEGMPWLNTERAIVAADPTALLPGARSVISVAMPYSGGSENTWQGGARGRIARYALSADYHDTLKVGLRELRSFLLEMAPGNEGAVVVDTGRVVDRAVAARSGLGWYGKNTMILTPQAGSWVMLGELISTFELPIDPPLNTSCGRCVRCLDKCPTGAIVAPGVIDSRRCISYLTIEHRGWIPRSLRPLVGQWIFGCDICQEVCPVNQAVEPGLGAMPPVIESEPELAPLLSMTRQEFRQRYFHTPVGRTGWTGFLRNVCIALGNARDLTTIDALILALGHDEPLVRGHAAWAISRMPSRAALSALIEMQSMETDAHVRIELDFAISALTDGGNWE